MSASMTRDERIAQIRKALDIGWSVSLVGPKDVAFLLAELDAATKREHDCMKQRNEALADAEAEGHAAEAAQKDIWALTAERDALKAQVQRLTDALDELVHAVDHEQSQSWCTTDIDTADAHAALAEGEDTRG